MIFRMMLTKIFASVVGAIGFSFMQGSTALGQQPPLEPALTEHDIFSADFAVASIDLRGEDSLAIPLEPFLGFDASVSFSPSPSLEINARLLQGQDTVEYLGSDISITLTDIQAGADWLLLLLEADNAFYITGDVGQTSLATKFSSLGVTMETDIDLNFVSAGLGVKGQIADFSYDGEASMRFYEEPNAEVLAQLGRDSDDENNTLQLSLEAGYEVLDNMYITAGFEAFNRDNKTDMSAFSLGGAVKF